MNEEEFTKKHPSLKGKVFDKLKKGTGGYAGEGERGLYCEIEDIDKTQIEKEKVRKVVDNCVEPPFNDKLKKELGLE